MKQCSKCKTNKPKSEFNLDPTKADGLYSSCKECKIKTSKSKRGIKLRRLRDKRRYGNTKHKFEARKLAREIHGKADQFKCSVLICLKMADNLHHVNYELPLDVVPLCRDHHNMEHSRRG